MLINPGVLNPLFLCYFDPLPDHCCLRSLTIEPLHSGGSNLSCEPDGLASSNLPKGFIIGLGAGFVREQEYNGQVLSW